MDDNDEKGFSIVQMNSRPGANIDQMFSKFKGITDWPVGVVTEATVSPSRKIPAQLLNIYILTEVETSEE